MIIQRSVFITLHAFLFWVAVCFPTSLTPLNAENSNTQAVIANDNVDVSMTQTPGGRPGMAITSSNTLWTSSDNKSTLTLHTNSNTAGGWGGVLELKRPGGGGTLGIKRPPEGGMPILSAAGSMPIYEANGTTVGVDGAVDSAGNREGHMSIKRP